MVYNGVLIPDNVVKFVVLYKFGNWACTLERRQNYYMLELAVACYKQQINEIGSSEDYEFVGMYYTFDDQRMHLIESYDTVWGYRSPDEWL